MPGDASSKSLAATTAENNPLSLPAALDATSSPALTPRGDLPPASPDDKTIISKTSPASEAAPPLILTPQHLGQALIGKRLDHYELVEFVGGGGMGAVFRATDTRLGRTVAVKVLSRDQTDDDTIRRFRNEAQSAARLDHPNIARVHFVGEDAGWNYIVFEFIEGVNLRDLVEKNGPLSVDDALNYTLQVAEALAHSSSRDVVHRDIKPSNVLVMPSGVVKLVDMGLARLHQVESSSDDLTASGVTLGTFDYISPEQARDPRSADVRSDIYSLGCTLYFMLVGRPPFPEGTALQKLLRHNGDDPPDPRLVRPELSPKVSALLAKMLAKRPSQRQQSADALIQEIVSLGDQLGLQFARRSKTSRVVAPASATLWDRMAPIAIPVIVLGVVLIVLDALIPPSASTADVTLRPKFTKPTITTESPPVVPNPLAEKAAAELLTRPRDNPDRSLRRDTSPRPDITRQPTVLNADGGVLPLALPPPPDIPLPPLAGGSDAGIGPTGVATPASAKSSGAKSATATELAANIPATGRGAASSSTGGMGDAPMASGVAPKPVVTKLVVQPRAESTVVDTVETVGSLSAACRRAAELGVNEIELHFDGDFYEKPFEVTTQRLTIRAGAGFRPRIVFRPELDSLADQRQMIRLTGATASRLVVSGVMFRLELPAEPSFGWSLFAAQSAQNIDLNDCILTIKDASGTGGPVHEQVSFFHVLPRRVADTMTMEEESVMAPQLSIGLTRTIARGEASLVWMPDESPLKLVWNQGLLVTTGRLIETGGTMVKPKWFGRIEIDLDHVTAVARRGLHQMRRRGGAAHQLDVDVRSNRSILYTAAEAPLFEFAAVPELEDVKLTFDGTDNCYPRPDVVFLRVTPAGPGAETLEFDLENRSRWSAERRPDLGVMWKSPANESLPAHEHTKANYVQADGAMNDAGFDPALLPDAVEDRPPSAAPVSDDDDPPPAPPMTTPTTPAASPTGMRIPAPPAAAPAEPMSRSSRGPVR